MITRVKEHSLPDVIRTPPDDLCSAEHATTSTDLMLLINPATHTLVCSSWLFGAMRRSVRSMQVKDIYDVVVKGCFVFISLVITASVIGIIFLSAHRLLFYSNEESIEAEFRALKKQDALQHTQPEVTNRKIQSRPSSLLPPEIVRLAEQFYGDDGVESDSFKNVQKRCWRRSRAFKDKAAVANLSFIIDPTHLCTGKVFLLIATIISADDVHARNVIRDTWASMRYYAGRPVEFVFVLGRPRSKKIQKQVEEEAMKYEDILQIDRYENDKLIARKLLEGLFRWTMSRCPQATYVFKTDEILFVDVFHVVQFLETAKPSHFQCHAQKIKPNRKRKSKSYVPYSVYRRKYYPTSCLNFGYFINTMIIKDLYMCNLFLQDSRFSIADIFFTGFIAQKLMFSRSNYWATHSWTYFKPSLTGKAASDFLFMRVGQPDIALLYWHHAWKETLLFYD